MAGFLSEDLLHAVDKVRLVAADHVLEEGVIVLPGRCKIELLILFAQLIRLKRPEKIVYYKAVHCL